MELLQTIQISLSNGKVGTFYGPVLVDGAENDIKVVDIQFMKARLVAGLQFRLSDLFTGTPGDTAASPVDRTEEAPAPTAAQEAIAEEQRVLLSKKKKKEKRGGTK